MLKWFKRRSTQEIVMMLVMIMLLVGIFMRREFIKKEGGESIRNRFGIEKTE